MKDVLIIGLGCAGYTAAIYCARYKLTVTIVGQEEGGMGMTAAEVGNWPGDIEVTGPDLMNRMKEHALSFDTVTHKIGYVERIEAMGTASGIRNPENSESRVPNSGFHATLSGGDTLEAKTVIFANGSNKRHLGIPGEEEFSGKGVTYCATCDAFFYKGKDVAVIGGGDAAVEGAAIAAQVANKVYLVHRRDSFRAEPYWVDKVKEKKNVVMVLERNAVEVLGDQKVTGVKLDKEFDPSTGSGQEASDVLNVDGVFIEVGSLPAVDLAKQLGCALDKRGFLKVGEDMSTNVEGVFGAGDVTSGSNHFAQFATAAGEGSVAANSVFNYLQSGK
jgi:thioredoxin reductase (NADPH)